MKKNLFVVFLFANVFSLSAFSAGPSSVCANPVDPNRDANIQSFTQNTYDLDYSSGYSTAGRGAYYDWGQAVNGWGYCYQYTDSGVVLNGGRPVNNWYCERVRPSYFDWSTGRDGWGYCYQYTPYGIAMNTGNPVYNANCERRRPSHYEWGRSNDGYTRCYQYTPYGKALNKGHPVNDAFCH